MAYFTKDQNNQEKKDSRGFDFDIDETGQSKLSRERNEKIEQIRRDGAILNTGEHCSYEYCGRLDLLPIKCDYCDRVLCKDHHHPDQHDCQHYIADLTTSPLCLICNNYIKVPIDQVKTRQDLSNIVAAHKESGCTQYSFQKTAEEKLQLKRALQCKAEYCNNHTTAGQKLSTIICKQCRQQVCLTHRFPEDHQCSREFERKPKPEKVEEISETKKQMTALKEATLLKMYGQITVPKTQSGKLGGDQRQSLLGKNVKQQGKQDDEEEQQQQHQQSPTQQHVALQCTTIPTRGTLIVHEQHVVPNVKTAAIQAKTRTKYPLPPILNAIPPQDRVYTVIYFPQSVIPTTTTTATQTKSTPVPSATNTPTQSQNQQQQQQHPAIDESLIPYTTQPHLPQYHNLHHHVVGGNNPITSTGSTTLVLSDLPPGDNDNNMNNNDNTKNTSHPSTLLIAQALIPQCGPTEILNNNNKALFTPTYVCLNRTWTIKECIDNILPLLSQSAPIKTPNKPNKPLPTYDEYLKLTQGKCLYTLSFLTMPHATLINSLTLQQVVDQYEKDFNTETEYYQGLTPSKITPDMNKPTSRKNCIFLPLHLAFGWYIDE